MHILTLMQDREVQWRCCGRWGGGSMCQRVRRTECQQASPDTLPLCHTQRRRGSLRCLLFSYCDRRGNQSQSRRDPRTSCSHQDDSSHTLLYIWFLCLSPLHSPILSTPPPSTSYYSDLPYREPASSGQICLDDRCKAAPLFISVTSLLSSDRQRYLFVLCLILIIGCLWSQAGPKHSRQILAWQLLVNSLVN